MFLSNSFSNMLYECSKDVQYINILGDFLKNIALNYFLFFASNRITNLDKGGCRRSVQQRKDREENAVAQYFSAKNEPRITNQGR